MCGEGFPDFYAKRALESDDTCINKWVDMLLKPEFDKFGICTDINTFGYRSDENDDPLIEDCQTRDFGDYYFTK